MALIKCSECGKEISDKARECPNCGCPIEHEIESGNIYFHWVGRKGDSIRKTSVLIDDNEIGILCCGDYLDYSVKSGERKITLVQGKRNLLEETVFISRKNPEEFFAFKESIGFSHPVLKKIDAMEIKKWEGPKKHVPKCPTCGSEKIKKNLFSGPMFSCKNCGYKW